VYSYSATSHIWFKGLANKIERAGNISIVNVDSGSSAELVQLAQRSMGLQCTIQDGQVWLTDGERTVQVERETLLAAR